MVQERREYSDFEKDLIRAVLVVMLDGGLTLDDLIFNYYDNLDYYTEKYGNAKHI